MRYSATVGERQHSVEIEANGAARRVAVDGRELTIDWRLASGQIAHLGNSAERRADHYSLLAGTHSYDVYARMMESETVPGEGGVRVIEVVYQGRPYIVSVQDARSQALASLAGGAHVSGEAVMRAPMPGLVVNVLAAEGSEVQRGETVVVLEAMKMENDLTAPRSGIVKAVRVSKGQTVKQGDTLVVVGDATGTSSEDMDEE